MIFSIFYLTAMLMGPNIRAPFTLLLPCFSSIMEKHGSSSGGMLMTLLKLHKIRLTLDQFIIEIIVN